MFGRAHGLAWVTVPSVRRAECLPRLPQVGGLLSLDFEGDFDDHLPPVD